MQYEVVDKDGVRWDVETSKPKAEASKKGLNSRQPQFKPFTVRPMEEEK